MKYIGWNAESGFTTVEADDEETAKMMIELNQDAVLLGSYDEIMENMKAMVDEFSSEVL